MIRIIAAASLNGVIGQNNGLPWGHDYPEDLKFFREKTLNSTIIMGRKTFESIGRALPKRRNIVLTRQVLNIEGIETFNSLEDALDDPNSDTWIIGGSQIYQQAIQYAEQLYITTIPELIIGQGIVSMPYINPNMFEQIQSIELSKKKNLYVNVFQKR